MASRAQVVGSLTQLVSSHGPRTALICGRDAITFEQLAAEVEERQLELALDAGALVALEPSPTPGFVVDYLAAMGAGCPVLVLPPEHDELLQRYRPSLLVTSDRQVTELDLHPVRAHRDLALLLSTSGSTGSPRLVRLSHRNVATNALAIAASLGLTPHDRGITSLPLHYTYGLSVLHSHLAVGASVVLSGTSVVDPCHWRAMQEHSVTSLAVVPHGFELLERVGFSTMELPALRTVTVAGGRMDPDEVRRWAGIGARQGWDLAVMYGQTEATARMAVLPPGLALTCPGSVGYAIEAGSFELRPHPASDQADVGEIVYRGPNVMMGYADDAGDLARGAVLDELATGDLGRIDPVHGVLEIVGRARRFVKPMGVRVDLDRLEQLFTERGLAVWCGGNDDLVAIATTGPAEPIWAVVRDHTSVPAGAVEVVRCSELPRLCTGKPDHAAVVARAEAQRSARGTRPAGSDVVAAVAAVLGGPIDPTRTFVELGGDSLSYVECSVRLEAICGALPADWHLRPIGELQTERSGRATHRATASVDTSIVLRAVAIAAVVATHMHLERLPGGAHLMLAVSGYNASRFVLSLPQASAVWRAGRRVMVAVAVPTSLWIALNMAIAGGYSAGSLFLVNNYFGSPWRDEGRWRYWYIEVLLQLMIASMVAVTVPGLRRLHQRWGYATILALLGLCLLPRVGLVRWGDDYNHLYRTHWVAWFFVLGWLAERSHTTVQRCITSVVVVAMIPGYFDRPQREWFIIGGLVLLVWCHQVPLPRRIVPVVASLGGASLWILLVHWQVWPALTTVMWSEVAYLPTLLAGVAAWRIAERVRLVMPPVLHDARARLSRVSQRRPAGTPGQPGAARPALLIRRSAV